MKKFIKLHAMQETTTGYSKETKTIFIDCNSIVSIQENRNYTLIWIAGNFFVNVKENIDYVVSEVLYILSDYGENNIDEDLQYLDIN